MKIEEDDRLVALEPRAEKAARAFEIAGLSIELAVSVEQRCHGVEVSEIRPPDGHIS
jgi:hypothetical protein